jgi:hypothetical protein
MAQALDPVVDGEQPADDEDPDGREQRPEETGLPVAQGMAVIGTAHAPRCGRWRHPARSS